MSEEADTTADEVRLLAVHPALWTDLVAWLAARGLRAGKIPSVWSLDPVYITSPIAMGDD